MKKQINLQLFGEEANTGAANNAAADQNSAANNAAATTANNANTGKVNTATDNTADEKKYSDKDLDEIINKRFARWEAQKQKEVDEAARLAGMSEQEKAEHLLNAEKQRAADLQKELDEYKRKDTLSAMAKNARKMLSEKGVNISDELLSVIITDNADTTKANVESFTTLFNENVEAAVKARLAGTTPTVGNGGGTSQLSEIDKKLKKYE